MGTRFELLRTYCGKDVHYIFTGISTAEGTFSTVLNLDDPQTVLIPDSVFYEFKPIEAEGYNRLLTLDQLEIGKTNRNCHLMYGQLSHGGNVLFPGWEDIVPKVGINISQ